MGGVDLLDRLLGLYRPSIRAKKWWWPLFSNIVNLSVIAAWRFYGNLHPGELKTHLQFRREIVLCLLHTSATSSYQRGRHVPLPTGIRYDGIGHVATTTTQGRCMLCKRNTRRQCVKCSVRLHTDKGTDCFRVYHKLWITRFSCLSYFFVFSK